MAAAPVSFAKVKVSEKKVSFYYRITLVNIGCEAYGIVVTRRIRNIYMWQIG